MEIPPRDPTSNEGNGSIHHREYPEQVETLVNKLEYQLGALEEILSLANLSDIATPEQLDAVKRISPTVHDLVRCLNDQQNTGQNRSSFQSRNAHIPRRLSEPDKQILSNKSAKNLMKSAASPSARRLLRNVLDRTKRRSVDDGEFESELPKDLLLKMITSGKSDVAAQSSVAYIAQTYGGVQFTPDFGKRRKSSFKMVASKVLNSNVFVRGLVAETKNWTKDKSGVNYLPTEFKLLSLDKRLQLAKMLSWNSLNVWGFNAFEVEKISSHINFSMDENNANAMDDSNRMGLEITERGCPIVLIGWAILASPYSQVSMNLCIFVQYF